MTTIKQILCANSKINNCIGIVSQKGTILCETCLEDRKVLLKYRTDNNVQEENLRLSELNKHLESENNRLIDCIGRQKVSLDKLTKENSNYEIFYNQTKIDMEKLVLDNKLLKSKLE